jgi:transmembrane sensor
VVLVGEAFFVVAKDTARPFIVTAGPAAVRGDGAQFDVRAYADENAARIVVDSGEVEVARSAGVGAAWTRLPAKTLARVARDGAVTRRDSITSSDYLGWRTGRIVFNDVPLRAALTELARWQNLDLQIGDSVVANRRVTATFASHQTVTEILDGIALQLGARYDRSGRTVIFRRER